MEQFSMALFQNKFRDSLVAAARPLLITVVVLSTIMIGRADGQFYPERLSLQQGNHQLASRCSTTQASSGDITICIESPTDGATVTGMITVEASVNRTGTTVREDELIFSLDDG